MRRTLNKVSDCARHELGWSRTPCAATRLWGACLAGAAVDCASGVLACGFGEPFGFVEGGGQVGAQNAGLGAQVRGFGLEGGDAPGAALPPGRLAFRVGLRHSCRCTRLYVTNGPGEPTVT